MHVPMQRVSEIQGEEDCPPLVTIPSTESTSTEAFAPEDPAGFVASTLALSASDDTARPDAPAASTASPIVSAAPAASPGFVVPSTPVLPMSGDFDVHPCEVSYITDTHMDRTLPAQLFADTGSNINCMSPALFDALCHNWQIDTFTVPMVDIYIRHADNVTHHCSCHALELHIRLLAGAHPLSFRALVYVRDTGYDVLIGNPTLRATGLKAFFANPSAGGIL